MHSFKALRAFGSWQAQVKMKRHKEQRTAAALAAVRSRAKQRVFAAWAAWASEAAQIRAVLEPALLRMRHARLASALAVWRQSAAYKARKRQMLLHCLQVCCIQRPLAHSCAQDHDKLKADPASSTWNKRWSRSVVRAQGVRRRMLRAALLGWAERAAVKGRRHSLTALVIARWRHCQLAACFARWAEVAPVLARHRRILQAASSRLHDRLLTEAMMAWRSSAAELRAERRVRTVECLCSGTLLLCTIWRL